MPYINLYFQLLFSFCSKIFRCIVICIKQCYNENKIYILPILQGRIIMNLEWSVSSSDTFGSNIFIERFDVEKYTNAQKEFMSLPSNEKAKYKGADDYVYKTCGLTLSPNRMNYKKITDEISYKLKHENYYNILPVNIYTEKETIMDLLASLENEKYIKTIYKEKKTQVSSPLNTDTATKLMDSIRQGRSLLQSAKNANMLSKPLIDFYAASAYAYAMIVINSPLHKSLDSLKGSHGHTYNHINSTIEFGGKIPSGTFIDLLASIYLPQVVTKEVHFKYSALSSLDFIQNNEIKISLIALLSTVPELQEQILKIDSAKNVVYNLNISNGVERNQVIYIFEIGDGIHKPNTESLKNTFGIMDNEIKEENGKYIVKICADKISNILPTIYQDINGNLWYVEPLIKELYLPEICLHFLIISALCNIMRYSPHEWNNILSNKISSDFSLLVSKYLRIFEIKFPMLLVQQLTNYLPIIVI